jgi:hypothetical protein
MSGAQTPSYVSASGGLDRIRDGVQAILPGAQASLVDLEMFSAIEEFCIQSTLWQLATNYTLDAGTARLDCSDLLDAGSRGAVANILQVNGLRRYSVQSPIVMDAGDLTAVRRGWVLLSLKPTELSDDAIPTQLVNDWSDAIRNGTLGRLMLHPAKPYSSAPLAQVHLRRFSSRIAQARASATDNGLRVRAAFPYFADGRQRGGFRAGPPQGYLPNTAVYDETNYDQGLFST